MTNTSRNPTRRFARQPKSEDTGATAATQTDTLQSRVPALKPPTKAQIILRMLQRDEGATLDQLVAATGWLPHTTRAALTGLKKKGHTVSSAKADGVRTYRVLTGEGGQVPSAAEADAKVDA